MRAPGCPHICLVAGLHLELFTGQAGGLDGLRTERLWAAGQRMRALEFEPKVEVGGGMVAASGTGGAMKKTGMYMGIGVALGAGIGVAMHHLVIGIAVGVVIGAAMSQVK